MYIIGSKRSRIGKILNHHNISDMMLMLMKIIF